MTRYPVDSARLAEVLEALRASPAVADGPLVRLALERAALLLRQEAERASADSERAP